MNEPEDLRSESQRQHDEAMAQASEAMSMVPALGALAGTESARAIAQVQAAALLARTHPRDQNEAIENILASCERYSLAEKSTYVFSRDGEEIKGPTIRLAEAIAQAWGNMRTGIRVLSHDMEQGISMCVAYCHDLQTGFEEEREFPVRHWRDIRGGKGYRLKSDRDIREHINNIGARSKRACIEVVVPRWVFEEAVERCNQTMNDHISTDEAALNNMLARFAEVGVTQVNIEQRIRRPLADIQPAQMVKLHQIYNSLKGQDSSPSDWFDIVDVEAKDETPHNLDAILARGRARAAAGAPPPDASGTVDDIERQILEARNMDELNAAVIKIGPLDDMDRKGRLYGVADKRHTELKAAAAAAAPRKGKK